MTWKPIATALIASLILSACRKSSPAGPTSNPTNYELTSMVWSGAPTNGQYFYFKYNSSHLMTDYESIQWSGGGSIYYPGSGNFAPLPPSADTAYFHLEYSNGRVTKQSITDSSSGMFGYWTYDYNSQGLITKINTYYPNGQSENFYYTYQYNDKGQLTDLWANGAYGNSLDYHGTYFYYGDGNLAKEVDTTFPFDPSGVLVIEYTSYDQKVNIAKTLNGFPIIASAINNMNLSSSCSPNNVTKSTFYGSVNSTDPFGLLSTDSSVYQYNEVGLPIQQQYDEWTVTYTYTKY